MIGLVGATMNSNSSSAAYRVRLFKDLSENNVSKRKRAYEGNHRDVHGPPRQRHPSPTFIVECVHDTPIKVFIVVDIAFVLGVCLPSSQIMKALRIIVSRHKA